MAAGGVPSASSAVAAAMAFSTWCSPASGQRMSRPCRFAALAGETACPTCQPEAAAARIHLQILDVPFRRAPHGNRERRGAGFEHALRFRPLAREDGRRAGLQNAGLFSGDRLQAAAQVNLVVEVDGGDDAQLGFDHVGGVQPPAQPHFEHRDFGFARERLQRHGGDGFEIGGVKINGAAAQQLFHRGVDAVEGGGKLRARKAAHRPGGCARWAAKGAAK